MGMFLKYTCFFFGSLSNRYPSSFVTTSFLRLVESAAWKFAILSISSFTCCHAFFTVLYRVMALLHALAGTFPIKLIEGCKEGYILSFIKIGVLIEEACKPLQDGWLEAGHWACQELTHTLRIYLFYVCVFLPKHKQGLHNDLAVSEALSHHGEPVLEDHEIREEVALGECVYKKNNNEK